MSVTVCAPAVQEVRRQSMGKRWCFICRARRRFDFVVLDTVEPSYWEPIREIECSEGHWNGDLGFGRVREWGDR